MNTRFFMRWGITDVMQTVSIVFAVTAAIAAGLLICLEGLKDVIGQHRWLSSVKFILCLLVLFGGPVGAADSAFWAYIVGGVLACAAVGLLCLRIGYKCHQQKRAGTYLTSVRSPAKIRDAMTTFEEALAVCSALMMLMFVGWCESLCRR
jgi:hypothetical protein